MRASRSMFELLDDCTCQRCGVAFESRAFLKKHVNKHLRDDTMRAPRPLPQGYRCPECDMFEASPTSLAEHRLDSHLKYLPGEPSQAEINAALASIATAVKE